MSDFLLGIRAAYISAYISAYKNIDVIPMKSFSKPRIYTGGKNFDLKKRWYVYYEYRNPHIRG